MSARPLRRLLRLALYYVGIKPLLFTFLGVLVKGKDHVREGRQRIVVSNHNSHLDTFVLFHLAGGRGMRRLRPVAAEDYFCRSRTLHALASCLFDLVPVRRGPVRRAGDSLARMSAALDAGDSLLVYPEGTRGDPEKIRRFRRGIGRLIARYPRVPVVPVYMEGLGKVLPKGAWYPVPFDVYVNIGEPRLLAGRPGEITEALERTVDELRRELARETRLPTRTEECRTLAGRNGITGGRPLSPCPPCSSP